MASIRRHPLSKYWYGCFTLPTGQRTQRSTKTTDRKLALKLANEWEKAAQMKLTETQARRVIGDLYEMVSGNRLSSSTTRQFIEGWLRLKKVEAGVATWRRYQDIADDFLEFLGDQSDADIAHLTAKQVTDFRDGLLERLTPSTANLALKILRSALTHAKREGLILDNPADRVKTVAAKGAGKSRRAFTLTELRSILAVADSEWTGMIIFGLYTGQRLGDIANLTWQNIDIERQELRLVTAKTGRQQIIPLAQPAIRHLEGLESSDDPGQALFPKANAIVGRTGRVGSLSNQFYSLMVAAGLAKARSHQKMADGRNMKREVNEISFHCLRHTATSLMKNAGISPAIVQEFIGHDSPAISANYTHIETEALRRAADSIPDIIGA